MKFKPKCLSGKQQTAVNNRGELLPCCYCDEQWALKTPQLKRLTDVSKISEVEDIEEILFSKPWMKFEEDLRTENWPEIPEICIHHCQERENTKIKKETYLYKDKIVGKRVV
jgi:hypothetical protein